MLRYECYGKVRMLKGDIGRSLLTISFFHNDRMKNVPSMCSVFMNVSGILQKLPETTTHFVLTASSCKRIELFCNFVDLAGHKLPKINRLGNED